MLQASHRCLLVCIVESCLVLLREEALSLFIAIEVETRYFFHIGEISG